MQQHHHEQALNNLPDEVVRLLSDEWNPSWLSLSSPYRSPQVEGTFAAFRQPNISSWIDMEEP